MKDTLEFTKGTPFEGCIVGDNVYGNKIVTRGQNLTVYFASDLHHGHKNISKYRTVFSSTEENDETLCENILTTCGKRDSLWLLGDLFFTEESLKYWDLYVKYVGFVNVVLGNHCTDKPKRLRNVKYMMNNGVHKIGGAFKYKGFWVTHMPIHPDELRGQQCLHGHMHHVNIDDPRYFNASVEQIDYKPISFPEILEIQKNKLLTSSE